MSMLRKKVAIAGCFLLSLSLHLHAAVVADFGANDAFSVLYSGSFDGQSGFVHGVIPNLRQGVYYTDRPSIDLGSGITLTMDTDYGIWGNDPNNGSTSDLYESFLYSTTAGGAVSFTISGLQSYQFLDIGFTGSSGIGRETDVTFADNPTVEVPVGGTSFTDVGTKSGATSYQITFAAGGVAGEGNLSGMYMKIYTIPEPSVALLLAGGMGLLFAIRRRVR